MVKNLLVLLYFIEIWLIYNAVLVSGIQHSDPVLYIYIYIYIYIYQFSSSLTHVLLFATLWTAACKASLSFTKSQSLFNLISIQSVITSNHLILCQPLLLPPSILPSTRLFSNKSVFTSGGQSIMVSASASVLSKNTQDL